MVGNGGANGSAWCRKSWQIQNNGEHMAPPGVAHGSTLVKLMVLPGIANAGKWWTLVYQTVSPGVANGSKW